MRHVDRVQGASKLPAAPASPQAQACAEVVSNRLRFLQRRHKCVTRLNVSKQNIMVLLVLSILIHVLG